MPAPTTDRTADLLTLWAFYSTGAIGLYLGLTGKRLSAPGDLLYSGLGTHHVRVEQLPSLREALVREPLARHPDKAETLRQLDDILQKFQVPL